MAGTIGVTGTVASAYVVDITDGEGRVCHSGLMSICSGVDMMTSPVVGGLLGVISFYFARFGDDGEDL